MIINVPEPKARAAGFWVRNRATGDLHFCDAHVEANSTLWTAWPVLTRYKSYFVEKAVDSALSAAGGTLRQAERFFDGWMPSTFWETVFGQRYAMGPGTAEFSAYFGYNRTGGSDSRGGLTIDDSDDATSVTGFPGAISGQPGRGPGGGDRTRNSNLARAGHGTAGFLVSSAEVTWETYIANNTGTHGAGLPVAPEAALYALRTGSFTAGSLGMGGSGGDDGGNGGAGYVRVSLSDITESTNRDLSGTGGADRAGSGGGYYAIGLRGFTLSSGTTIDLRNGNNHASYGKGRATLFTVNNPTITGTFQGGVVTEFQIYPAIPFGGALVSG